MQAMLHVNQQGGGGGGKAAPGAAGSAAGTFSNGGAKGSGGGKGGSGNMQKLVGFAVISFILFALIVLVPSKLEHHDPKQGAATKVLPELTEDADGDEHARKRVRLTRVSEMPERPPTKVLGGGANPQQQAQTPDNTNANGDGDNAVVEAWWAGAPPIECKVADKEYSQTEIAQHSAPDDLWIVIKGYVLNVTAFVPDHPGGNAILNAAKRPESLDLFIQFHQPSTVGVFGQFCIGKIAPDLATP